MSLASAPLGEGCGILKRTIQSDNRHPISRQHPVQRGSSPVLRRRMIWSVAALFVVGVLTLGVFNAIVLPGCESCHDQAGFRAATAAEAHSTVDCRTCHVPAGGPFGRFTFSLRQPLHMFIPITGGARRDAAAVPDSRCLACHEDILTEVTASGGLRIVHETCSVGAACSDCHSVTAHGEATPWVRSYYMDRCLTCHASREQTACDLCHEGRDSSRRVKSGSFAVTHGPQWRATHGMSDAATCAVCHQEDDCVKCHGPGLPHEADFVDLHAEYSVQAGADCAGCHPASFCDACHGTSMPHTAQFTVNHPEMADAQSELCKRCHVESDCTTCHVKHVHPGGAVGGTSAGGGGS